MKRARSLLMVSGVFVLLMLASAAVAQTIPGVNTPFGGLIRTIAGIEVIKAEIVNLRRELSRCDGPGAAKTVACASRALLQAKLNYLLEVSMMLGDPDTAGAPPVTLTRPAESSSNYTDLENYLEQEIRKEAPPVLYVMSENRAKWSIIQHCKAMKDRSYLRSMMTPEEVKAGMGAGAAKTRADVNACVSEFDAKAISATRKTAVEYCFQSSSYTTDSFAAPLFDACMNRHDMLQAMCKRQLELQEAYSRRKRPQQQHAPQTCMGLRLSPGEIQAVQAAPAVRTMAELPPTFFAPPDVVIPPRPPLPIPSGTVLELKLQGGLDGIKVEIGFHTAATLDQALVVGGQTVIPANSGVILKTRIIGPGARPNTVQIGLTTDEVSIDSRDCKVCGNYADLRSNELVFTVPNRATAANPGIPSDTKLRFTIGGTGTVVTPPAQPASASPAPTPPTTAGPPPPPAGSKPPDPQQQADEIRKQAERRNACMQQAMKDNPRGGLELAQALAACAQTK